MRYIKSPPPIVIILIIIMIITTKKHQISFQKVKELKPVLLPSQSSASKYSPTLKGASSIRGKAIESL